MTRCVGSGADASSTDDKARDAAGCFACDVVARAGLSESDRDGMFELFMAYYERVTRDSFELDLSRKDWVVLLRDDSGRVRGFTTFALYESTAPGHPVSVVFSGDTIVDASCRSTTLLPRAWIKCVLAQSADMPQPLFWLLISSGYKTYRFLTVFLKEWYPCHDRPTPDPEQGVLDGLAHERFGSRYDAQTGVVRLRRPTPLRSGVAEVTPRRLRDPHVAFFVSRNPGHEEGDELVCLTRLHPDNFSAAGHRVVS